jgi:hypothetical protein
MRHVATKSLRLICARNHADISFVHLPERRNGKLKFTIEIYTTATDGSEWILHRTTISAVNPLAAPKEANYLFAARKKAIGARILNADGAVICTFRKSG